MTDIKEPLENGNSIHVLDVFFGVAVAVKVQGSVASAGGGVALSRITTASKSTSRTTACVETNY